MRTMEKEFSLEEVKHEVLKLYPNADIQYSKGRRYVFDFAGVSYEFYWDGDTEDTIFVIWDRNVNRVNVINYADFDNA